MINMAIFNNLINPGAGDSVRGLESSGLPRDLHHAPPTPKVHTRTRATLAPEPCLTGLCFLRVCSGLCSHRDLLATCPPMGFRG